MAARQLVSINYIMLVGILCQLQCRLLLYSVLLFHKFHKLFFAKKNLKRRLIVLGSFDKSETNHMNLLYKALRGDLPFKR